MTQCRTHDAILHETGSPAIVTQCRTHDAILHETESPAIVTQCSTHDAILHETATPQLIKTQPLALLIQTGSPCRINIYNINNNDKENNNLKKQLYVCVCVCVQQVCLHTKCVLCRSKERLQKNTIQYDMTICIV